jgi:hypothetical protein
MGILTPSQVLPNTSKALAMMYAGMLLDIMLKKSAN